MSPARSSLGKIFGDPIERVRFARTLRWREPDSNYRFSITRPRFQDRLMSPLPDSPPTEIRSEREPTPRGCRAPSAGPMIRILFPPAASLLRLALRVSATSGERSASEIARRNIAITSGWQTSRTTVAPSLVKMDVSMSRLCGAGRSGGGRIRAARFAITLEGPRAFAGLRRHLDEILCAARVGAHSGAERGRIRT